MLPALLLILNIVTADDEVELEDKVVVKAVVEVSFMFLLKTSGCTGPTMATVIIDSINKTFSQRGVRSL